MTVTLCKLIDCYGSTQNGADFCDRCLADMGSGRKPLVYKPYSSPKLPYRIQDDVGLRLFMSFCLGVLIVGAFHVPWWELWCNMTGNPKWLTAESALGVAVVIFVLSGVKWGEECPVR